MHVQIVMNNSGDTRHVFDHSAPADVESARARFRELTEKGYSAVGFHAGNENGKLLREFDADVQRTVFIPQLRGG